MPSFADVDSGEGVVDSACAVGATGGGWKLRLLLKPWRRDGGELIVKLLYLDFHIGSEVAIGKATRKRPRGTNVAVSLASLRKPRPNDAGWWGKPNGTPGRIRANAKRAIKAPQATRHIDDEVLGRLRLNRQFDWYEGTRKFRHREYQVAVMTPDPDDAKKVTAAVKRATKHIHNIERDLSELREAIVDELLEVYNTKWRGRGRPLSRAGFKKRLSLNFVVIQSRRTTAHFSASSLFR